MHAYGRLRLNIVGISKSSGAVTSADPPTLTNPTDTTRQPEFRRFHTHDPQNLVKNGFHSIEKAPKIPLSSPILGAWC
jgi:hypothetical protein